MKKEELKRFKYLLMFTFVLIFSNLATSQCEENIITNGSFNDSLGFNVTATGWLSDLGTTHSPDINNDNGILNTTSTNYIWIGNIISSPNGGTWQNIIGPEIIYQIVELDLNKTYSLCFEYSAQGITNIADSTLTFDDPVGVEVYVNDSLMIISPIDTTQYTWENYCLEFTVIEVENHIKLKASTNSYLGLDGVCLTEVLPISIETIDSRTISVFPNPVSIDGLLSFKFNDNNPNKHLRILNAHGHLVWSDKMPKNNQLNLVKLNLKKGIYYFSIIKNNGEVYNGKFIGT